MRGTLWVDANILYLAELVVMFVKRHQVGYLKWVHFIIHKLYLNTDDLKRKK